MLLYAKRFAELSAALHRMKYLDRFAADAVIHDLKKIPRKIKANNNIFIVKPFHKYIGDMGMENVPNIGFVNPMLKRGRNTDNFLLHASILVQNAGTDKRYGAARRLPFSNSNPHSPIPPTKTRKG
jgi:hypothetical protein